MIFIQLSNHYSSLPSLILFSAVFEAGLGASGATFSYLQENISRDFATFAYDRLGMGWSAAAPTNCPRDAVQLCHELQALLDVAHASRPLIFVGHSYGGLIARTFVSLPHSTLLVGADV
jgi:pimeloyl-ACP methyl ester carboxylesterase